MMTIGHSDDLYLHCERLLIRLYPLSSAGAPERGSPISCAPDINGFQTQDARHARVSGAAPAAHDPDRAWRHVGRHGRGRHPRVLPGCLAIFLTVLAGNLCGDGWREALAPHLKV